jgi:hypothetical protein
MRGRKPKAVQEAFQLEVQEKENQKSIYEKKIEDQLPMKPFLDPFKEGNGCFAIVQTSRSHHIKLKKK